MAVLDIALMQAKPPKVLRLFLVGIQVGRELAISKMLVSYGNQWSRPSESNRRPFDYESNALPTELGRLARHSAALAELQNIRFRGIEVKVISGCARNRYALMFGENAPHHLRRTHRNQPTARAFF